MAGVKFNNMVLTEEGEVLLNEFIQGARVQITQVLMGNQPLIGGQTEENMTYGETDGHWIHNCHIESINVTDGYATIYVQANNEGLETSFDWRELGVIAQLTVDKNGNPIADKKDVLLLYGNVGNNFDRIPTNTPYLVMFSIVFSIGNVDNEGNLTVVVGDKLHNIFTTVAVTEKVREDLDAHRILSGSVIPPERHVPAIQSASNKTFLRNDNTWATVVPKNIGAVAFDASQGLSDTQKEQARTNIGTDDNYVSFIKDQTTALEANNYAKQKRALKNLGIDYTAYDKVIRNQTEFNELIASSNWLGAKSVLFTNGMLEYNGWITIPAEVKTIAGAKGAKITLYVSSSGKFGYTNTASNDSSITGLSLEIKNYKGSTTNALTAGSKLYGFHDLKNLIDCTVVMDIKGENSVDAVGFYKCKDSVNCYSEVHVVKGNAIAYQESHNIVSSEASATGTTGYGYVSCNGCVSARELTGSNQKCTTALWGTGNTNIDIYSCEQAPNGILVVRSSEELTNAVSKNFYGAHEVILTGNTTYTLNNDVKFNVPGVKRFVGVGNPKLKFTLTSSATAITGDGTQILDNIDLEIGYNVSSTASADIRGIKNFNAVNNCTVTLNVTKTDTVANATSYIQSYGFDSCSNLTNCNVVLTATNNQGTAQANAYVHIYGFYNCVNIVNCISTLTGRYTKTNGSSNVTAHCYDACKRVVSCNGKYTADNPGSTDLAIFYSCDRLVNCGRSDSGSYTIFNSCTNYMIEGDLSVQDKLTVGNSETNDGATINGKLSVSNTATLSADASVGTTLTVGNTSTKAGVATVNGTLTVEKATTLKDTLSVSGNTTVGGTLGVTGAITASNSLTVGEKATFNKGISVTNGTSTDTATVGTTLTVSTTTDRKANVTVHGALTVGDTTNRAGSATVHGTLTVGDTTNKKGVANVNGTLTVEGATTLKSGVTVTGTTNAGTTLNVGDSTKKDGTANINGTINLNGTINVGNANKIINLGKDSSNVDIYIKFDATKNKFIFSHPIDNLDMTETGTTYPYTGE